MMMGICPLLEQVQSYLACGVRRIDRMRDKFVSENVLRYCGHGDIKIMNENRLVKRSECSGRSNVRKPGIEVDR